MEKYNEWLENATPSDTFVSLGELETGGYVTLPKIEKVSWWQSTVTGKKFRIALTEGDAEFHTSDEVYSFVGGVRDLLVRVAYRHAENTDAEAVFSSHTHIPMWMGVERTGKDYPSKKVPLPQPLETVEGAGPFFADEAQALREDIATGKKRILWSGTEWCWVMGCFSADLGESEDRAEVEAAAYGGCQGCNERTAVDIHWRVVEAESAT